MTAPPDAPLDVTGQEHARVWVQIWTDQEVVEAGIRTILETAEVPFTITTHGPPDGEPDVILFDVATIKGGDTTELERWLTDTATTVVAINRMLKPELGVLARQHGVEWSIDLDVTAQQLTQVVMEAVAGDLTASEIAIEWNSMAWVGHDVGLSPRESQVLHLVVSGLSNHEIAQGLHVSINSVKTYIRSAYRKLGVRTRPEAILWGVRHGFASVAPT